MGPGPGDHLDHQIQHGQEPRTGTRPASALAWPRRRRRQRRRSSVGSDAGLAIGVNGQPVGTIHPVATNALRYNTDKGVWQEYIQKFDASLLKPGENEMTFTVPAGDVTTGVVYDYLRLELNDGSKAYPAPPDNSSQRPDYPTLPAAAGTTQAELH